MHDNEFISCYSFQILEIARYILALYEQWKTYNEKSEIVELLAKMPKPKTSPSRYDFMIDDIKFDFAPSGRRLRDPVARKVKLRSYRGHKVNNNNNKLDNNLMLSTTNQSCVRLVCARVCVCVHHYLLILLINVF